MCARQSKRQGVGHTSAHSKRDVDSVAGGAVGSAVGSGQADSQGIGQGIGQTSGHSWAQMHSSDERRPKGSQAAPPAMPAAVNVGVNAAELGDTAQASRRMAQQRLAQLVRGTRNWKQVLASLLVLHNGDHAVRDKRISYKTMHERRSFLFRFFEELHEHTRYKDVDPRCLKPKHVQAMVSRWLQRGLCGGTIHNYVSYLHTFEGWIGKQGLILQAHEYVGARTLSAASDKSWSGNGVDVLATLEAIRQRCAFVAIEIEFCWHFAMRGRETRMLRPHEAVIDGAQALRRDVQGGAAQGAAHYLRISQGAKGGRPRDLPITTPAQRELIERARTMVPPGEPLARPGYSLKQNSHHFHAVLRAVGVTGKQMGVTAHGLRHEWAGDNYDGDAGAPPPVRGGPAQGQVLDRQLDRQARDRVANFLGHSRREISNAYLGATPRKKKAATKAPALARRHTIMAPANAGSDPQRLLANQRCVDAGTEIGTGVERLAPRHQEGAAGEEGAL